MNLTTCKILVLALLGLIKLLAGLAPMLITKILRKKSSWCLNRLIGVVLCLGGGVLLSTVFLHILPEVRETLEKSKLGQIKEEYPWAELIICLGFLAIFLIETVVHKLFGLGHGHGHGFGGDSEMSVSVTNNSNTSQGVSRPDDPMVPMSHSLNETERPQTNLPFIGSTQFASEKNVYNVTSSTLVFSTSFSELSLDALDISGTSPCPSKPKAKTLRQEKAVSSIRSFLVVLALSVHSIFEGMAIGLQGSEGGVWKLFIAVAVHATAILFCIGMEMISTGTRKLQIVFYMTILAAVSPIGVAIGIVVSLDANQSGGGGDALVIGVLQGVAGGTLLYITFFEVLDRKKLAKYKMSGMMGILAILLGFGAMAGLEVIGGHAHLGGGRGHGHLGGGGHEHAHLVGGGHEQIEHAHLGGGHEHDHLVGEHEHDHLGGGHEHDHLGGGGHEHAHNRNQHGDVHDIVRGLAHLGGDHGNDGAEHRDYHVVVEDLEHCHNYGEVLNHNHEHSEVGEHGHNHKFEEVNGHKHTPGPGVLVKGHANEDTREVGEHGHNHKYEEVNGHKHTPGLGVLVKGHANEDKGHANEDTHAEESNNNKKEVIYSHIKQDVVLSHQNHDEDILHGNGHSNSEIIGLESNHSDRHEDIQHAFIKKNNSENSNFSDSLGDGLINDSRTNTSDAGDHKIVKPKNKTIDIFSEGYVRDDQKDMVIAEGNLSDSSQIDAPIDKHHVRHIDPEQGNIVNNNFDVKTEHGNILVNNVIGDNQTHDDNQKTMITSDDKNNNSKNDILSDRDNLNDSDNTFNGSLIDGNLVSKSKEQIKNKTSKSDFSNDDHVTSVDNNKNMFNQSEKIKHNISQVIIPRDDHLNDNFEEVTSLNNSDVFFDNNENVNNTSQDDPQKLVEDLEVKVDENLTIIENAKNVFFDYEESTDDKTDSTERNDTNSADPWWKGFF